MGCVGKTPGRLWFLDVIIVEFAAATYFLSEALIRLFSYSNPYICIHSIIPFK